MADDNRPLKYMRYAIGEIALVVIGILIALQINTWNEQRKSQIQFDLLLKKVQKELLVNIGKCKNVIEHWSSKDSLYYNVHNKKVTYDNYYNDRGHLFFLIGVYENAKTINDDFKNLIEFNMSLNSDQDSIVNSLKRLNDDQKVNLDRDDKKMAQLVEDFFEKSADQIPLFSRIEDRPLNNELINYFLNDPFYLNQVYVSSVYGFQNHLRSAEGYASKAIEIHDMISEYFNIPQKNDFYPKIEDYSGYKGDYLDMDQPEDGIILIRQDNELLKYYDFVDNDTLLLGEFNQLSKNRFFTEGGFFATFSYNDAEEVDGLTISRGLRRFNFKKIK